jgi:hypothetical protein
VCIAHPNNLDHKAPLDRVVAVGNVVRRPEDRPFSLGSVQVPDFLKKIFNLTNKEAVAEFDDLMNIDDECYLGKNGDAEDCVDFDPLH